jgi:hypothetical protein
MTPPIIKTTEEAVSLLDQRGACLISHNTGTLLSIFTGKQSRPVEMTVFVQLIEQGHIVEVTRAEDAYGTRTVRYELAERVQPASTTTLTDLLHKAASYDGEHHKQWLIVEALKLLGEKVDEYERGIAP